MRDAGLPPNKPLKLTAEQPSESILGVGQGSTRWFAHGKLHVGRSLAARRWAARYKAVVCPACQSRTISFLKWCSGLNAFRWTCPHCGAQLKATWLSLALFLLCVLAVVGVTGVAIWTYETGSSGAEDSLLLIRRGVPAAILATIPIAYLAYRRCAYRLR